MNNRKNMITSKVCTREPIWKPRASNAQMSLDSKTICSNGSTKTARQHVQKVNIWNSFHKNNDRHRNVFKTISIRQSRKAAVRANVLTGDPRCLRRADQGYDVCDVLRLPQTPQSSHARQMRNLLRCFFCDEEGCLRRPWRYRVDSDATQADLFREDPGHLLHS